MIGVIQLKMPTNTIIKYFDSLIHLILFLTILTVDYFSLRQFYDTDTVSKLTNIFVCSLHAYGSFLIIKKYLKNISLKNQFNNSESIKIFIKKYFSEFSMLIFIFCTSFLIGIMYYSHIHDKNLLNLFYERTTAVFLPSIISSLNNFLVGLIFSVTSILFYFILRSAFISKYISFFLTIYFISSPTHIYNLIPSPFRDYFKATIIFFILIFFINLVKNKNNINNERLFIFLISFGIFFGLWIRSDFLIYIPLFLVFLIFIEMKKNINFVNLNIIKNIFPFIFLCIPHFIVQMEMVGDNFAVASSFIITQSYNLGIENGLYDFGYIFIDEYLRNLINLDKNYTINNIIYLPADFLIKLLATQINVLNLPFQFSLPPPGLNSETINSFYLIRFMSIKYFYNYIFIIFYISVFILIFKNPKIGYPLGLIFIFIISYPIIQNQIRHYFYIEIISLWSIGFLIEKLIFKNKRYANKL